MLMRTRLLSRSAPVAVIGGAPKTKASNATIPVNQPVIERLQRLKTITVEIRAGNATRHYPAVKSARPNDLVFQSVMRGRPMRDNNVLIQFIKPAATKLGIPWLNWQALRRSHATWLKLAGSSIPGRVTPAQAMPARCYMLTSGPPGTRTDEPCTGLSRWNTLPHACDLFTLE